MQQHITAPADLQLEIRSIVHTTNVTVFHESHIRCTAANILSMPTMWPIQPYKPFLYEYKNSFKF